MTAWYCVVLPALCSSASVVTTSSSAKAVAATSTPLTTSSTTISTTSISSVKTSSTSTSSATPSSTSSVTSSSSKSSSSVATSSSTSSSATASATGLGSGTVGSTILVIARDDAAAADASSGLNGYGIPFQTLVVPKAGASLPVLNSSSTSGNFGGFIVDSGVIYDFGTSGYLSALTTDQWSQLYAYQINFGVRMVQYGVYPGADYGTTAIGGCCEADVEQLVSFTNTTSFTQAGLKLNAGLSSQGLYHYPSSVANKNNTVEIAKFAASSDGSFLTSSTAGVINNFSGREQMVFFIDFATDWSATSAVLQHAFITWMTRGLYAGYRRVNLGTQIDDMLLATDIYYPVNTSYRVTATDMTNIASWVTTINAKMPSGSSYYPEIGYNGNGNIIYSEIQSGGAKKCTPGAIQYDAVPSTELEFQKVLGTGSNFWPKTPTTYGYASTCLTLDPLEAWFAKTTNRDQFMHISHTFSHEELNNATYSDALKEIQFNQAYLSAVGIASGKFSSNGLIPPAITGMHNGDVLKAWHDAGLTNCVGDNTRPVLRNTKNQMWPLITTVANNGYDGYQINPRFATRIYYNCDSGTCTTQEWVDTSAGIGVFNDLLALEKADTTRHLFGLYHDPYMFHQANLRNTGSIIGTTTINGVAATISIFQAWVETVVQEFVRLANWPIITLKQSDFTAAFAARMARDQCGYGMSYQVTKGSITGVTVTATGNTCTSPIPITVPGSVTNTQGFTTEKIGNDPLTIWVTLKGTAVSFTLSTPVALM